MVVLAFYSLSVATEFENDGGENGREGFFTESSFHKNITKKSAGLLRTFYLCML